MEQTTRQFSRKEKRAIRARESRKAARLERMKALSKTPVASSIELEINSNRVITFEDLDGDQLVAYNGICEWWNVQSTIGGVSEPLTVGGFAGTGKSTLLSICLPNLKNSDGSDVRVNYCAYTGKAANVLMTKGLSASTIHSLIYNAIPLPDGKFLFELKDREDIGCQLIVVDEASMIPKDMQKDLESLGIPVLYTGDHGQLPPVEGYGNVMNNPRFKLETPHRQALESGIIQVATMFRQKERVKKGVYGKYGDTTVLGKSAINDTVLLSSADMVICHSNSRRKELNNRIREYRGYSGVIPQVGEKLICTRNNKNTRMFNGLIATVRSVEVIDKVYVMDLEDETGKVHLSIKVMPDYFTEGSHPRIFGETFFDLFEYAYAITGHKSQGSQWDNVVVIQEDMYRDKLEIKRRWIYTTVTRAAKKLTLISKHN